MVNIENEFNNETNDFDLEPEKSKFIKNNNIKRKVPLSTILTQIQVSKKLLMRSKELNKTPIINSFDGLKMWVNLAEHSDKINFHLENMEETIFPTLPPNPHRANLEELAKFKASTMLLEALKTLKAEAELNISNKNIEKELFDHWEDENEDEDNDDDSEFNIITENDIYSETINLNPRNYTYPNSKIPYDIYIHHVGIVNIYIKNDILVIWITGKFTSNEGDLGLITRENIRQCLNRIINLHLFSFDVEAFIEIAGCYIVDNTIDLLFDSELQTTRMINAISSFLPIMSKEYYSQKYKRNGLLIRKRAAKAGYSLAIYCKGEELRHSLKTQNRAILYTNRIGETGEDIARRTLRLELHMKKFETMRELLNIPKREQELVLLRDVLTSTAMPILKILYNLGIDEEKLIKFLIWYQALAEKDEQEKPLTDEEITDLLVAERITELVKENDFNNAITKAHIIMEYNISSKNKLFDKLIPYIKTNLYKFLCFRKPKTITAILNLLKMIYATYSRNTGGNNE